MQADGSAELAGLPGAGGAPNQLDAEIEKAEGTISRKLPGRWDYVVAAVALALTGSQLYTAFFGVFPELQQRALHWLLVGVLVFLLFPARRGKQESKIPVYDVILAIVTIITAGYVIWDYEGMYMRIGDPTRLDLVLGSITILLIIEATRRTLGWPLPIIAIVSLLYIRFGSLLPQRFGGHSGFDIDQTINLMYLSPRASGGSSWGPRPTSSPCSSSSGPSSRRPGRATS